MPPAHMQLSQSSLLLENFDARDKKVLVRNVAEFEKGFDDAALSDGKEVTDAEALLQLLTKTRNQIIDAFGNDLGLKIKVVNNLTNKKAKHFFFFF